MQQLSIPNLFTFARLGAVPVFAWLFLTGHHAAALALFIGAALTDILDGALARALKQFTRLGAVLDPVADKLLALTALCSLTYTHLLPAWLLGVALFRDACIFVAIWLLTRTGRSYEVRPTRFGKYATFFLVATIFLALVQEAQQPLQTASPSLKSLALTTGLCVLVSWAQYLAMLVGLMRKPPDFAPGSPRPKGWLTNAIAGPRAQAAPPAGSGQR